jgi:hypothetical protein
MKVFIKHRWLDDAQEQLLSEVVERHLDGDDPDRGSVEAARATANNCADYLGRLTMLLVEKKVLTLDDVRTLVAFPEMAATEEELLAIRKRTRKEMWGDEEDA